MFFHENIFLDTEKNPNFRTELVTGKHSQVVLMSIEKGQDIGMEVHDVDQILIIVDGMGQSVLNGERTNFGKGYLIFVPAGTKHNIINTGTTPLKLFTIYSPPEHKPGTVHKTKQDAINAEAARED
ncbi:cupin domain-containing protein [Candidatus Dependentiae bacterium]|nr:cupin domain-containing protein [Candidatus Dependentiae bacterium]